MSVRNTQGPWKAVEYQAGDCWQIQYGDRGNWLAEVVIDGDEISGEADARLIAAAPELLEALDRALGALQRLHTDVEALMADSEGVAGLHHNGDVAKWDDLTEGGPFSDWVGDPLRAARNAWHDGRAAIAKASEVSA